MSNEDEWESAQISRVQYPDDWREWPEDNRKVSQLAVDRLLKRYPEAKVIWDRSFCMLPGHPRYPDPEPGRPWNDNAFWLVRTIKLDLRTSDY
jgi:hypothetical protein